MQIQTVLVPTVFTDHCLGCMQIVAPYMKGKANIQETNNKVGRALIKNYPEHGVHRH